MGEVTLMRQAYRFALDPSIEQEALLRSFTGASRFWFNVGLALVKERLDARTRGEEVRVPWSYKALCSAFRGDAVKDELAPWRSDVPVGSYQAGLEALGKALHNFSEGRRTGRRVGFPRFRVKGHCRESVIFQRPRIVSARQVEFDRRLGPVRARERLSKLIRLLERDEQARVMRATVSRSGANWYVSFTVERSPKKRRARRSDAAVGVDLGLTRLATPSAGQPFKNTRPLQEALRKLRRLQRQLDRQRRANNRDKHLPDGRTKPCGATWATSKRMLHTEARRCRLQARVANLRREQAHQLTTYLTREFGVIGVEALAVKNLMANRRLARHIADVGWGMILVQLAYKTAWSDACLRPCHGPRPQRGPEPGPGGTTAGAGRGKNEVLRRPHRTGDEKRAPRGRKTQHQYWAQPNEARRLAARRAHPDSREPGCRCLFLTEATGGPIMGA